MSGRIDLPDVRRDEDEPLSGCTYVTARKACGDGPTTTLDGRQLCSIHRDLVLKARAERELREIIDRVCTEKEKEVLQLVGAGASFHAIARILGLDRKTIKERFERAQRKIQAEVVAQRGIR